MRRLGIQLLISDDVGLLFGIELNDARSDGDHGIFDPLSVAAFVREVAAWARNSEEGDAVIFAAGGRESDQ